MIPSRSWLPRLALAAALVIVCGAAPTAREKPPTPPKPDARGATPDASPAGRCRALLDDLKPILPGGSGVEAAKVEAVGDDGCRFTGVRLLLLPSQSWEVETVVVSHLQTDPRRPRQPPAAMRLEAHGVRFVPRAASAAMRWMFEQQQVPFDVALDYALDQGTKRLTLRELSMTGEVVGRVALSGEVDDFDLDGLDGPDADRAAASVALRSLSFDLHSKRFIAVYVLPIVAGALSSDPDPGATVEAQKRAVSDQVQATGHAAGVAEATVSAISGFIEDFPHPRHPFTLALNPERPITQTAMREAVRSPEALAALVWATGITATYEGGFAPP